MFDYFSTLYIKELTQPFLQLTISQQQLTIYHHKEFGDSGGRNF